MADGMAARRESSIPTRTLDSRTRGELKPVFVQPDANVVEPVLLAATSRSEPTSVRLARLAKCEPALPERLHLEISNFLRARFTPFAFTHATTPDIPELLGTAPVERDGSFFVQVPSEQPLQFELLDAAGKSVKARGRLFLDAARRAARLRGMPRRPGNGAGECRSTDPAEINHPGGPDRKQRPERRRTLD